jgi:hypothetical protein
MSVEKTMAQFGKGRMFWSYQNPLAPKSVRAAWGSRACSGQAGAFGAIKAPKMGIIARKMAV